jgi:acetyltransferase-like isoleucine patch superfamily enzyme
MSTLLIQKVEAVVSSRKGLRLKDILIPFLKKIVRFLKTELIIKPFLLFHGVTLKGSVPWMRMKLPILSNEGTFEIGSKCRLRSEQIQISITVGREARLMIGNNVGMNSGTTIGCSHSITIEDDVSIGGGVHIFDTNFHEVCPGDPVTHRPVVLKRNCWIGVNAIIHQGVTIGENAVIGAGCVITEDVPAYTVMRPPKPCASSLENAFTPKEREEWQRIR